MEQRRIEPDRNRAVSVIFAKDPIRNEDAILYRFEICICDLNVMCKVASTDRNSPKQDRKDNQRSGKKDQRDIACLDPEFFGSWLHELIEYAELRSLAIDQNIAGLRIEKV